MRADIERAGRIFDEHGDFIRRIIRYHVRDESLIDDLFQDFFLSLAAAEPPAETNNIRGYLYRAITNDVADAVRRVRRYRCHVRGYAKRAVPGRFAKTPEDASIAAEQAELVYRIIEHRLTGTEARAVTLRYNGDCDVGQTADRLGIKNSSASRYVSNGLAKIRRLLAKMSGGPDETG
jgi:RNA polymerase sigma factor (sigma-70 family)